MRNRETVLSEIKQAVFDERECQLHVLHLLREVETDQHFLSMGYPNLFEFATRELGYSSGSAMRRIQSMRLLKTAPQMEEKLAELALKKLSPEPKSVRLLPALAPSKTRFIPAGVKRELWKRDGGNCTYTDPKTGKRCGSRHAIQFDHIRPYAWNGETSVENLRLRCRAHNIYTARLQRLVR